MSNNLFFHHLKVQNMTGRLSRAPVKMCQTIKMILIYKCHNNVISHLYSVFIQSYFKLHTGRVCEGINRYVQH